MDKNDLSGSMSPESIGPKDRKLIDQFLELRQSYQAITQQIEHDLQTPLDHYQQKRLFYLDVGDLTHFRLNFFDTVGYFLRESLATTYHLEIWDRQTHQKRCYSLDELQRISRWEVEQGTAIETITYGRLGYRIRRTFDIYNCRLYVSKTEFFNANEQIPLIDGLMLLQQELNDHTLWIRGKLLRIKDFT
ncbi:hypothetical protein A6F53_09255 [Levilactobacillus brevis]|uniref:hypothetical protein n=1 Tax=Levilactobacillus brevis TaxID=1580 RepID=UPI0007F927CA|nr:hypothetical protein [Levilactobacillus brevis]ANN49424.1 hypothetical protein A6F53_09255 [Levilactobacillus brevis]